MDFSKFPEELRAKKQWVMWKKEPKGDGKWTKVPYRPDGRHAATTRPEEWYSFDECVAAAPRFSGIGFVFSEGYVGIDLDHCFEPSGLPKPWASEVLATFDTYTERSPSGDGLHLIIASDVALKGRKADGIECYSQGRFFTVTGDVYGKRDAVRDLDVLDWHAATFGEEGPAKKAETPPSATLPEDAKVLSVMFKAKNGEKNRALYERGDWAGLGYESQSNADLALAGNLMFYCANDKAAADRLFRGSALMRPKWDEFRGSESYGEKTLGMAVSSETMSWAEKPEFIMSGGEHPKPLLILENICRAMESDRKMTEKFRLNDFSHAIEANRDGKWDNMNDYDVLEAQCYVSTAFPPFARVCKEMVVDGIRRVAQKNKVNPPRDYLTGLTWDKTPRLDTWLCEAYGAPDTELFHKMGSNWMKGLVKRVLHPGCQFDEVLVLESPQGYRKSTSLRVLGNPWHVESTLSTEDKDFYMLLARNIIVEFSEGDIVGRTSARKLKAIITKTEDSFRPPYERGMMAYKRGCVFAMTTNDSDYQKDDTGGRRWLPVVLTKVADVDWIEANRDQLYAEAVYRTQVLRETSHEYPMEELTALQSEKQDGDDYDDLVQIWYASLPSTRREVGVTGLDAYREAIAMDQNAMMSKEMQWRVGAILRRALRLTPKSVRIGDIVAKRWMKT